MVQLFKIHDAAPWRGVAGQALGHKTLLANQDWPTPRPALFVEDTITLSG